MSLSKRICILYCSLLLLMWILCLRLYTLSGSGNKALTVLDGQYSGRIDITQRSGLIYDRYFEVLSHDKYTGLLVVNPSECENISGFSNDAQQLTDEWRSSQIIEKAAQGIPFTVTVSSIEAGKRLSDKYKGVYFVQGAEENTDTAQHFIGYSQGNRGITGLRYHYNDLLYRELYTKSYGTFSRNAANRSISKLTLHDMCGKNTDGIITSIDKELQHFCDSLESLIKSGCIVVADSSNGEILALSSFPHYDASNLSYYLDSEKGELLNRSVQSYTPGSVFKIIISASALEANPHYYDYTYSCMGSIDIDSNTFNCHKKQGHGTLSMKDAFAQSCNCYFMALASEIGIEKIILTARKAGLDTPAAADFLYESSHRFINTENTSAGYLANISIGQGDLCISPLDMINVMICASTGYSVPLSAVLGKVSDGKAVFTEQSRKKKVFTQKTVDLLCTMMEECVNSGTGRYGKSEDVRMGGKTATAQTGRFNKEGVEYVHKWFCGFYDGTGKRYVFCILCDNTPENLLSPSVVSGKLSLYFKENGY